MSRIATVAGVAVAVLGIAGLMGCKTTDMKTQKKCCDKECGVTVSSYGKVNGKEAKLYTLKNCNGAMARITDYGGIVVSINVPDKNGKMGDVVLGRDSLADYVKENPYFGCLIGRYGNRIAKGKFTLNGKEYTLATNNGVNHLHGGKKGFDKVLWSSKILKGKGCPAVEMSYVSKDGEEGYPGNLKVTVVYSWNEENALTTDYTATTDKDTICNLTQHSYFNLAGTGTILDHEVMIASDAFTPVDSTLIPTGELRPVAGTPFDFNTATKIGARIDGTDEQLVFGKGYDHNWVIKKEAGKLGLQASVYEPTSGRVLEVLSTEPGLQFYSGNFLDGKLLGKNGTAYQFRSGFCMEPQHYPDSPNKAKFPSTVLKPGETYKNTIVYKFSVKK